MPHLKAYDKEGNILAIGYNVYTEQGSVIIPNLKPHTKYPQGEFYVSWEGDNYESEKTVVPEFTTLESSYKEITFYAKDILTVKPKTAYDIAVDNGFTGTEGEWVKSIKGEPGEPGKDGKSFSFEDLSAEQLSLLKGKQGEPGKDGKDGKSSYELAVEEGFQGELDEYLDSLHGEKGEPLKFSDLTEEQIQSLKGQDGTMTFEDLTEEQKASLKGEPGEPGEPGRDGVDGKDGLSAYQVAKEYGYKGTEREWLESLKMDNNEVINARGDKENLNERITYIESSADRVNKNYSSIEEYGGKITDSFDNSSIVNNLVSTKEDIYIKLPKGNIKMSNIILPSNKNIIIEGSGEGITNIDTTGQFFRTYNPLVFSTEVSSTSTLAEGETEIPLLNTNNVKVGQLVTLVSNEDMEETSRSVKKYHTAIITDIKDNNITLDRGLPAKFTLNSNKDYVISVKGYKAGKIKISNLTVSGEYNGFFIDLQQTYKMEIDSVTIKNKNKGYQGLISGGTITQDGGEMKAIRAMGCVDLKVRNCSFEYISYGVMPTGGTTSVLVENCTALRCRHVCAPTGGSQNVTVSNCNAYHCFAGYDSHQTAYDTKHINCSSYHDEIPSKFRGRIDYITGCNFEGGIELSHDPGLVNTKEYVKFTKQVSGGTIVQKKLLATGINVTIRDVYVNGILNTLTIHNSLIISDTTVKLDSFEGLGNDTTGKRIDYMLWLSFAKSTSITNINLIGSFEDKDRSNSDIQDTPFSAIKINRDDNKGFVKLEEIIINGFDYGIYLPISLDMSNFKLSNININSCVTGIYNEPNYKDNLSINNINFKNNKINILEPFRFRYKNRPESPLKGQEYYDEGIKKKIIYDGSNWIDFNGNIV